MKCTHCHEKEANTHIKRTINGVTQEMYLCEDCAKREFIVSGGKALYRYDERMQQGIRQRFLVPAGVGQQAAQQRTEQCGDAAGQTADIQNLHDAAPKAEDAGHRKAQLQSGLGTVQRGGGHGAEVPVKKAPKEGEDHQTGPDIRHCHRSTLPSIDFEKWVHCNCMRERGRSF